jgi:iron complex outermembrane receptor protein
MTRKFMLFATAALAALATAAADAPALAQDQQAGAQEGLGEIIITATRRDTDLQTTAIAVSAVDAQTIQTAAPRDLGDLAVYVPNFSASRITGFNAASFAMRGVGQNNIIVYYEPPVAVLVDDFVVSSVQTQLLDTFDIAQVEVLRGPQGTLFGRNTTGGAVVVRTIRPDLDEAGARVRMMGGSFETLQAQASLDLPLVPGRLGLRLVGGYDYSDGHMRNGASWGPVSGFAPSKFDGRSGQGRGERVSGTDVFAFRAKLLWEPVERLSILGQYEFIRDRSESPAAVQETPTAGGFFLFNALGVGAPGGDPIRNAGVTNRNFGTVEVGKGHPIDVRGYYLNADLDLDVGTITSVTGYRTQHSALSSTYTGVAPIAADGEVLSLFDANREDERETFQQEIRFASRLDGPLQFVAGGFFQKEDIDFCVSQLLGFLDLASGPLPFGSWNTTPYILCNAQKSKSYALFTEATFELTDRLTLTGGFRYTWENKIWRGRQQAFAQELKGGFDPTFTYQQLKRPLDASVYRFPANTVKVEEDWAEPTWRVSLGYEATSDLFGYFTYSRGFKSGGFNDQIGSFAPFGANLDAFRVAASPTDPERADSFEAGIKSEFWDNRIRFNLTGFYVIYRDIQKQIVVPITVNGQPFQVTRFFNAAKAKVKGIEAEATALLFDGFTLRGALGYQDGRYEEYVTPIPPGYDLTLAPLDRAPEWTWSIDGTWRAPIGRALLTLNANVNYVDENLFTQSIDNIEDNTFLNARTLVNASATLSDADERLYVRFLARNLTDKRYRTASQTVGGLWTFSLYGEPRFFGVEAGVRFGGR